MCLFCVYTQEYGDSCASPNTYAWLPSLCITCHMPMTRRSGGMHRDMIPAYANAEGQVQQQRLLSFGWCVQVVKLFSCMLHRRWVYLAYIDSVKYFQPERAASTVNCALRTLVYHELLQVRI